MPAHPKPAPKARSTHAMRSKPKAATPVTDWNPSEKAPNIALTGPKAGMEERGPIPRKRAPKKPQAAVNEHMTEVAKIAAKASGTKSDLILGMLKKPGGASSKEMEAATGWAPHSVRGFLGTLRKKGVAVLSKKFAKGEPTVYSIEAAADPALVGDVV